jgi:hypothetical protein
MRRSVGIALAAGLTAVMAAGPAAARPAPAAGTVPAGWVHHAESPWSWWTPKQWVDAHGNNDLDISSPTGDDWVVFNFSAAPVANAAATPEQNALSFMQQWLSAYQQESASEAALYSLPMAGAKYTSVSKISDNPPTISGYSDDYRVTAHFVGIRADKVPVRGEIVVDYVESAEADTGIQSTQIRSAPRHGFATTVKTLRTVQHFIAYTGSLT